MYTPPAATNRTGLCSHSAWRCWGRARASGYACNRRQDPTAAPNHLLICPRTDCSRPRQACIVLRRLTHYARHYQVLPRRGILGRDCAHHGNVVHRAGRAAFPVQDDDRFADRRLAGGITKGCRFVPGAHFRHAPTAYAGDIQALPSLPWTASTTALARNVCLPDTST